MKIAGTPLDGRFALSPLEKQLVQMLRDSRKLSYKELATKFQVSEGTIKRALGFPQPVRAKASYRYNPKNKESLQKSRAKKKLLFKKSNETK
jgi:predicted DNA-binding transcriptional regulator YafY